MCEFHTDADNDPSLSPRIAKSLFCKLNSHHHVPRKYQSLPPVREYTFGEVGAALQSVSHSRPQGGFGANCQLNSLAKAYFTRRLSLLLIY